MVDPRAAPCAVRGGAAGARLRSVGCSAAESESRRGRGRSSSTRCRCSGRSPSRSPSRSELPPQPPPPPKKSYYPPPAGTYPLSSGSISESTLPALLRHDHLSPPQAVSRWYSCPFVGIQKQRLRHRCRHNCEPGRLRDDAGLGAEALGTTTKTTRTNAATFAPALSCQTALRRSLGGLPWSVPMPPKALPKPSQGQVDPLYLADSDSLGLGGHHGVGARRACPGAPLTDPAAPWPQSSTPRSRGSVPTPLASPGQDGAAASLLATQGGPVPGLGQPNPAEPTASVCQPASRAGTRAKGSPGMGHESPSDGGSPSDHPMSRFV